MRWAISLLCIIAFTIGAALIITDDAGYVLIVKPPYRYELSLSFLVIMILMSFLLLHLCLRFINYIQKLPANSRAFKEGQRLKDGTAALLEGMHALAIGDVESAKKAAERAQQLIKNEDLGKLIRAIDAPQQKKLDL